MEDELRCPKCKSSQTRYRLRTKNRICYHCGNIWKLDSKEEIKKEEENNGTI